VAWAVNGTIMNGKVKMQQQNIGFCKLTEQSITLIDRQSGTFAMQ